jgi:hypothetical protein
MGRRSSGSMLRKLEAFMLSRVEASKGRLHALVRLKCLISRRDLIFNVAIVDDMRVRFSALLGVAYETENQEAIIWPLMPCDL